MVTDLNARGAGFKSLRDWNSGQNDYLVKPFAFSELLARLCTLLRRGPVRQPDNLRVADLEIDLLRFRARREGTRLELTPKEFALLSLLVQRTGGVLSRTLIAEQVWDMNFDSNTNVVDVAVRRLRSKVERSQFDARKALAAVRDFYEAVAEEQDVEVICHGEAQVYADPMLFRRAVSNLLSNALHHTPRSGTITLAVSHLPDQAVDVRVCDTGCGIAPELLPKLFDRFYRVDPARAHHPLGTGLGLAIVKSIMELHGGTVTVQSALTVGTTMTLTFPPPTRP